MPLTAPNLDDMQYADIVSQAQALIPRYTPEWTNFNNSDPGMTLVQLFAWMTEILIYRLNQVPDLNYIKFLQLLGIELQAAQPAVANLTFSPSRPDLSYTIVPQGTQVAAAGSNGGQPIVFETDTSLVVIGPALSGMQSFDGLRYSNIFSRNNNPGQWFYPFGQNPQPGSALLLGFATTAAFPVQQIDLAVTLYANMLTPLVMKCGGTLPPPATIAWEYWDGSEWASLSLISDGTRAFTQNGHVLFNGPGFIQAAPFGQVTSSLYWIRARVVAATYEMPPQLASILTNTVQATQAVTISDEVLGGSDGTPNQSFTTANNPICNLPQPILITNADGTTVTITSLRLEVDEGEGFMVWQQVQDFFASGPDDANYTLDATTGVVVFGDGVHGRIPGANLANPTGNIVARSYRYGGGSQGNLPAQSITQIQTFVPSINAVTNYAPSQGGTDEESVANAKLRAPLALESKNRAVTNGDFIYLATQAPGANVARANALPLYHPNFPQGQIPGVVTVVVVPNSNAPNPTPNQTTLQAVCQYLDAHRLLTTEVYVIGPTYRMIQVLASLVVQPGSDLATVQNAAVAALNTFFSPLTGGPDGTGWPFGGTIYYSDVYRILLGISGVQRVISNQLILVLDNQRQQLCQDVAINPGELLYNAPQGHQIQVAYSASGS
jgi:predicted phage baseplate assembly protein